MAEVGGDLETLRNLHKGLDEHAQKALDFKTALDGHVSQAVWKGANADKFRAAWEEFVQHVNMFKLRGPMRGALVSDDMAWLAVNLDILDPPTPYRFFYVWLREEAGWKIVVSHDAVSRPVVPRTRREA